MTPKQEARMRENKYILSGGTSGRESRAVHPPKLSYSRMNARQKFQYTSKRAPILILLVSGAMLLWMPNLIGIIMVAVMIVAALGQLVYTYHQWKKSEPPEE